MSIWDDPKMKPPTGSSKSMVVGEEAIGTVIALTVIEDAWGDGKSVLEVVLDKRTLWANAALWQELAREQIEPGDRIKIHRLDDKPLGGGKRVSQWTVEKQAGVPVKAPAW